MIYTVTLNPPLDRALVVEKLVEEDTTRVLSETFYAVGKGIDVSRVIKELGGKSVALGLFVLTGFLIHLLYFPSLAFKS